MHDTALVVFSGFASLLILLPLPLHWRARNPGTLCMIAWLFVGNLVIFVDGIVWWDNMSNPSPVWCDIVSKVYLGVSVGVPASSLCITRRLVMIASSTTTVISQKRKRIALGVDVFLALVFPFIVMALHYVVQPHRFNIMEGYGCMTAMWDGIPAIFLVIWWPVLLNIAAAINGTIAIKFFLSRRLQFQTLLRSSKSGLDGRHYLRLMMLSSVDIIIGLPFTLHVLVDCVIRRQPYPSWEYIHADWSLVTIVPASYFLSTAELTTLVVLPLWQVVLVSIIFFLFFGVSEDAIAEYSRWYRACSSRLPCRFVRSSSGTLLPVAAPKLGSSIATPAGQDWRDSFSSKENRHDTDEQVQISDSTQFLPQRGRGVAVGITVEREVV